jgi:hypothetical protein
MVFSTFFWPNLQYEDQLTGTKDFLLYIRVLSVPDFVLMELVSYVSNRFEHQILLACYPPVQKASQFVSHMIEKTRGETWLVAFSHLIVNGNQRNCLRLFISEMNLCKPWESPRGTDQVNPVFLINAPRWRACHPCSVGSIDIIEVVEPARIKRVTRLPPLGGHVGGHYLDWCVVDNSCIAPFVWSARSCMLYNENTFNLSRPTFRTSETQKNVLKSLIYWYNYVPYVLNIHRSCRYNHGAIIIPPWYCLAKIMKQCFFCIKTSITKYQGLVTPYPRPPGVPKKIKEKKKNK